MAQRNQERIEKLRIEVRYLLNRGQLVPGEQSGNQSRLAKHFKLSRQRVHQIVVEERAKRDQPTIVDTQAS